MEYFDVLDEQGNKTGERVERGEAHRKGICHRTIEVWVLNSKNELLLQKRSANKDICPNLWYLSLGGHMESGETAEDAIPREFQEELGLSVSFQEVTYLYTFQETAVYQDGAVVDNEFCDVYLLRRDLNLSDLALQAEEVAEVAWMHYEDFKAAVQRRDPDFLIHKDKFFPFFQQLDRLLSRMEKLKLVKLSKTYMPQLVEMMDEWTASGEKIVPYAIRKTDYHNYREYVDSLETSGGGNLVPDSTYFCLDLERNIFVGAVNIRHYLNDSLLQNGGHIGDGVRPSERGKGIATKMIGLALHKCKKLGIDQVLMVCDKDNIGSAKSILNNGGVLENEINIDGTVMQRYWIKN